MGFRILTNLLCQLGGTQSNIVGFHQIICLFLGFTDNSLILCLGFGKNPIPFVPDPLGLLYIVRKSKADFSDKLEHFLGVQHDLSRQRQSRCFVY